MENIGGYLSDLGAGKDFLNKTRKVLILEVLKQRTSNDTFKKFKRQVINRLG